MGYASGKHAFGFCDRCDQRFHLKHLYYEIYNEKRNGLRVCGTCLDEDHPQLQLGKVRADDSFDLEDPRPDRGQAASRGLFGWKPVTGLKLTMSVGTVRVVIT